jgi:glycosyltransferase involved in cell wall biosynthesis
LFAGYLRATVHRREVEFAFARRIFQAAATLCPEIEMSAEPQQLEGALGAFERALASSTAPDRAKAWLSLVAVDGRFPEEGSVGRVARVLRMGGAKGVRGELTLRFAQSVKQGRATLGELDVRRNAVVIDVTHTAITTDLHTGIQRVVRETVARWIDHDRPMGLIRFDLHPPAPRALSSEESERFKSWRKYVGAVPAASQRVTSRWTANTVVPWQCDLFVPELAAESPRVAAYRGLGTASVVRSLSMVGYDVIPIAAAETVAENMTELFGGYLSVVKHADRVSAISRATRDSFRAFATMAAAEGLPAPLIAAHELPAEAPQLDERTIDRVRLQLGIGGGPLVLVVGSHEPRKNHLTVLEAAERLWSLNDRAFQLVFVGWSGWLGEDFDELVDELVASGRPLIVRKRCSEEELWASYRLARFTVFPSLIEGYGLPIAESLASGTPVITSNYGSMAEIGEKGGCLLVDPRSVDELERAMSLLLEDDDALSKLRDEALSVDTGTWERYANDLWSFFTGTGGEEQLELQSAP